MDQKEIDAEVEKFVKSHAAYDVAYKKYSSTNQLAFAKAERLNMVFQICGDLIPATCGIKAKLQLDTTLNVVEDGFSKIEYAPKNSFNDGRMYPAQEDYRRRTGFEEIATYEHRSHYSHFGCNGAISIVTRKGNVIFDKAGADKITVGELRELSSRKISSSDS